MDDKLNGRELKKHEKHAKKCLKHLLKILLAPMGVLAPRLHTLGRSAWLPFNRN